MREPSKWIRFEKEKQKLLKQGLSAVEYERAVRKLCEKLKI